MGRTSLASLQARLDRKMSPVIVTWNVVEYRKAAEKHVCKDDVVLEVGCCGGTTTSIIGKHCSYVLGIDQTKAEIEIARNRFGRSGAIEFEEMDAFDMGAVMRLQQKLDRKFNKVFIDINGSRDIGTVYDCVDKYQKVLHPELIVLKSIKVRTLLHQCIPWNDDAGPEDGDGDGTDSNHRAQRQELAHSGGDEAASARNEDGRAGRAAAHSDKAGATGESEEGVEKTAQSGAAGEENRRGRRERGREEDGD